MKGEIIAVSEPDVTDRTVDLLVQFYKDTGEPLVQRTMILRADGYTPDQPITRLRSMTEQELTNQSPIPITKAQVEADALGQVVIIPG